MTPEQKLKRIARIYETTRKLRNGSRATTHAYYNLVGATLDLERTGKADKVILHTLKSVQKQLAGIGKVLGI